MVYFKIVFNQTSMLGGKLGQIISKYSVCVIRSWTIANNFLNIGQW